MLNTSLNKFNTQKLIKFEDKLRLLLNSSLAHNINPTNGESPFSPLKKSFNISDDENLKKFCDNPNNMILFHKLIS